MRQVGRLFQRLVSSQFFISSGAGLLCLHTNLQFGQGLDYTLASFVFLSTLFCYRLFNQNHVLQYGWKAIAGSPEILTIIAGLLAGLFYFLVEPGQRLYILLSLLLTSLYALPLLQSRNRTIRKAEKLLPGRQKGFAKLLLICVVWSWSTVALPYAGNPGGISIFLFAALLAARALFIAGITIPFDIRDRLLDHPYMNTLPQRIGVRKSLGIAVLALLTASGIFAILVFLHPIPAIFFAVEAVGAIAAIPLVLASPQQPAGLFFTGLLDGLLVLVPLIGLILAGIC